MKDNSLVLRAQEIIAAADGPMTNTEALTRAIMERNYSGEQLAQMLARTYSSGNLRKRTYELPEQDALFSLPSVICVSTKDGDLFIRSDKATVEQGAQYADEGYQYHCTQRQKFKRLRTEFASVPAELSTATIEEIRHSLIAGAN